MISCASLTLLLALAGTSRGQDPVALPQGPGKTLYYGREPVSGPAAPPAVPVLPPTAPTVPTIPELPAAAPGKTQNLTIPDLPQPLTLPAPPGGLPADAKVNAPVPPPGQVAPPGDVVRAQPPAAQPPRPSIGTEQSTEKVYGIHFDLPNILTLAPMLESESAMQERIRQKLRTYKPLETAAFPADIVLTSDKSPTRVWALHHQLAAPNYVCYQRTYFDQINFERYGWDLGPVTPVVSAGKFFLDVALLPYHAGTDPCRKIECNAGWCLPGDPVPLLLYPPHFSVTGLAAEASVIAGGFFVFP